MSRLWWTLIALEVLAALACSTEDGDGSGGRLIHGGSSAVDGGTSSDEKKPASDAGDAGKQPPAPAEPEMSGEATYYDYSSGGACGLEAPDDLLIAAINDEQYSKENCGRCASVKGPKGTVVVEILDKCPGCDSGDLDLSEQAFVKIAAKSDGRVKITWSFVDCPR